MKKNFNGNKKNTVKNNGSKPAFKPADLFDHIADQLVVIKTEPVLLGDKVDHIDTKVDSRTKRVKLIAVNKKDEVVCTSFGYTEEYASEIMSKKLEKVIGQKEIYQSPDGTIGDWNKFNWDLNKGILNGCVYVG